MEPLVNGTKAETICGYDLDKATFSDAWKKNRAAELNWFEREKKKGNYWMATRDVAMWALSNSKCLRDDFDKITRRLIAAVVIEAVAILALFLLLVR